MLAGNQFVENGVANGFLRTHRHLNLPNCIKGMTTYHHKPKAARAVKAAATLALLTLGTSPFFSPAVRAADPYDKGLEARVEALEKELNIMEDDSKGKNVAATPGEVPTFSARGGQRGAGTDDLGRPALSLQLRQRGLPVPRRRQRNPAQPVCVPPAAQPQLHLHR